MNLRALVAVLLAVCAAAHAAADDGVDVTFTDVEPHYARDGRADSCTLAATVVNGSDYHLDGATFLVPGVDAPFEVPELTAISSPRSVDYGPIDVGQDVSCSDVAQGVADAAARGEVKPDACSSPDLNEGSCKRLVHIASVITPERIGELRTEEAQRLADAQAAQRKADADRVAAARKADADRQAAARKAEADRLDAKREKARAFLDVFPVEKILRPAAIYLFEQDPSALEPPVPAPIGPGYVVDPGDLARMRAPDECRQSAARNHVKLTAASLEYCVEEKVKVARQAIPKPTLGKASDSFHDPLPDSVLAALTTEMQAKLSAFMREAAEVQAPASAVEPGQSVRVLRPLGEGQDGWALGGLIWVALVNDDTSPALDGEGNIVEGVLYGKIHPCKTFEGYHDGLACEAQVVGDLSEPATVAGRAAVALAWADQHWAESSSCSKRSKEYGRCLVNLNAPVVRAYDVALQFGAAPERAGELRSRIDEACARLALSDRPGVVGDPETGAPICKIGH